MKKLFAAILSALTVASMASFAAAADPALTLDTETRGDWVGKYGTEGYYILGASYEEPIVKMPENTTIEVTDFTGMVGFLG